MDKVKIQDIAEEAELSNAELVEKAKELGFDVKAGNSKISMDNAGILVDYAIAGTLPKGFKKPGTKSGITVVKKKVQDTVKPLSKGLGKILEEVEEAYEKDLENATIKTELKIFFDEVYTKNIHISCLEIPIFKMLLTDNDWFTRDEIIKELEIYGQFKRAYLSFDHLWSQRFAKGKETLLLNKLVEHDADKKGRRKNKYRIKEDMRLIVRELVKNYSDENIENLINLRLIYTKERNAKKENNIQEISKDDIEYVKVIKKLFSKKKIAYTFSYKNILLKGVPGTGKSRTLENIIHNQLNLKDYYSTNVLRVNVHSASSNADLMQGIGISSNDDGHIEYKEKQGLILELIERATFHPKQPFVLVLEEVQENSLNELIGDLIYLIEDSKRAKGYIADNKEYTYNELIENIIAQNSDIESVKLPSLISKETKIKQMIIPHNLYIFCTSNYRDDRKVIEDNLLRRFEVIEIYPRYRDDIGKNKEEKFIFVNKQISDFLRKLNQSIVKVCSDNGEIHPDRFMIGHSIWLNVNTKENFSRAFLKVITEFKDIKDTHFDDFVKITKELKFPFKIESNYNNYEEWIKALQTECYDFLG